MHVDVREEPMAALEAHARIPIAFRVERVLDVVPAGGGLRGLALVERRLREPYLKDYDAVDDDRPTHLARRFDLANWGVLAAWAGGDRVGGAVLAFATPGLRMLRERPDVAVLWDLRVRPEARGRGVGHRLFAAAEAWAARRGCISLEVETQNVNVPACEFYARQGCVLRAIDRFAYPTLADEAQLLWSKPLAPVPPPSPAAVAPG